MVELYVVGDARITVNDRQVTPSSPMLFAALLYLAVEKGRRVRRVELQELLFPEAAPAKSSHSIRQLVYKLKQLGVVLNADSESVSIPAQAARIELSGRADLGVLSGYAGDVSSRFAEWVEAFRAHVAASLRTTLLKELAAAKEDGNTPVVIAVAERLLAIDPLNEEAVLSRAEALAVLGQKAAAVQSLDEYKSELSQSTPALTVSTEILRRRISERTPGHSHLPLLGRQQELADLLSLARQARDGQATLALVWGEAGIGKTRLVQELEAHLSLQAGLVQVVRCRPHDVARPMGPFLDVLPTLLRSRGASGIKPASFAMARSLVSNESVESTGQTPELLASRLRATLEDLLECVSAEAPIAVIVEDAQWLDSATESFLANVSRLPIRVLLVLTYRSDVLPSGVLPHAAYVRKLAPLSNVAASELLNYAIGNDLTIPPDLLARCVSLASGNALFLCTIGAHFRRNGFAPTPEATLHELLKQRISPLGPLSLLVLRTILALGAHANQDRLFRCLELRPGDILLAMQDLADHGMILSSAGGIHCMHDLLADVVLSTTARPVLEGVMRRAAEILEQDGHVSREPALLWSCAEAWRVAAEPRRSGSALRQCATIAVNIGQPTFAIGALEKAQTCVAEVELGSCIEDTIRIASDVWDSEAVLRNVARIRSWRLSQGKEPHGSAIAEIAAINTLRISEIPIWDKRDLIRSCALNGEATVPDRLRAARLFLLMAEEQLDSDAAVAMHDEVLICAGSDADSNASLHYSLAFHGAFGALSEAASVAYQLLDRRTSSNEPVLSALQHCAFVLYRSGSPQEACDLTMDLLSITQKVPLSPLTVAHYAAQLGMMLVQLGDAEQAQHYTALAQRSLATIGKPHTGATLSNLIEIAVLEQDYHRADTLLRTLREQYATLFTPNRERSALGNELLLSSILGTECTPEMLNRAEHLYKIGGALSEADALARGLAAIYAKVRGPEVAKTFLSEYLSRFRRDRHELPAHFHTIAQLTSEAQRSVSWG